MSKSTLLLVVTMSLISYSVISQNLPPILQADKPQRGIYLDFNEFVNNTPSIHSEFELKPRSKGKQFWGGGSDYALVLKDSDPNKKKEKKFWGVSTGDSVYVNVANYQATKGYIKFQALGRYCFTKGQTSGSLQDPVGPAVMGGIVGGVVASIPREAGFILNINNGNFYMLHPDIMMKILSKDAELLNAYGSEKEKKDADVMLTYIDRYNQRHPEEIGVKEKLAKVILYRREKKERRDTITIFTSDSSRHVLGPGDLKSVNTAEETITLCASGECKNFPVVLEVINYIECSYREGEIRLRLIPQEKKVGEFYVREIQVQKEERQEE